jgi:transcriptional regulator with XRE-family HTH domain
MTNLADVADQLKAARLEARLSQTELARRAGVARTTVARMETVAKGDMSPSVLVRLLEAAGCGLKVVKTGHTRTLEDVPIEQRSGGAAA